MPVRSQKSISLPDWVIDEAETYLESHRDELKAVNVTNVTALVRYLILQANARNQKHE